MQNQLNIWTGLLNTTWAMCYRRSRDGTGVAIFINNCRGLGPIMVGMSKSGSPQAVLGGYTNNPGISQYSVSYNMQTSQSFLYTFNSIPPKRFPVANQPSYYHAGTSNFWFGGTTSQGQADLWFDTNVFQAYSFPFYYTWEGTTGSGANNLACQDFVGGACNAQFIMGEMEVWYPMFF
jgi:hypothetical protein